MNWIRSTAALICIVIAGCGASNGGGSNDLSVGALSPSSVTRAVSNLPTNPGQDVALTASYSGTPSGPVYVVVQDPDTVFTGAAIDTSMPSSVTLHLFMGGQSPLGRYTRPLVVHVCRDTACNSEYSGFPRTIQKDVTIEGTTTNVTSLSFTSTAGLATASQTLAVTPPAGVGFDDSTASYADYTAPDGTKALFNTERIFTVTKTATGFDIHANAALAGHYTGQLFVQTVGYQPVAINLDYQVGPIATAVATSLTASASGTSQAGSSVDQAVYIDILYNVGQITEQRIAVAGTNGSPDPTSGFWLRYYDFTPFTYGSGPANNATRMRLYLNACFFGQSCLPPGHYTADVTYSATAWSSTSSFTVPVTFDVTP